MEFHERLVALRRSRNLTQQQLADATGVHVSQIKRYEKGSAQPTLGALRKLVLALGVPADTLLFEDDERGPHGALRLQYEAVRQMSANDQKVISALLDAFLKRDQSRRSADR